MFARVASFENIDSARAAATLEEAEAIGRPLIGQLPGYVGNFELAAENGKVLSVTLFDTEENARGAEHTFYEALPQRLGHLFADWSGRRISVDRYEVVSHDWK